jgi:hypothetical protein
VLPPSPPAEETAAGPCGRSPRTARGIHAPPGTRTSPGQSVRGPPTNPYRDDGGQALIRINAALIFGQRARLSFRLWLTGTLQGYSCAARMRSTIQILFGNVTRNGAKQTTCEIALDDTQAIFWRRRHQPRMLAPAIRPGPVCAKPMNESGPSLLGRRWQARPSQSRMTMPIQRNPPMRLGVHSSPLF